jgi:hypothetical protein
MNSDRRSILALIAMGRITPAQAERLLAVANEGRETAMILALCLAYACLAQLHLHELLPGLMHLLSAQIPALSESVQHVLSPITGPISNLIPLTRMGGLL